MANRSDFRLYCYMWDSERQEYIEISIDNNNRPFGFPDSADDGRSASEILMFKAVFPNAEEENGIL